MHKSDYLFGGENPYTLTMLRKRWARYIKALGVEITQHQLRHAYSFLLYRSGVDVKSAQYLLGHSNYTTTMNIYTDFDKTKLDTSANALNNLLQNI
jgi:integrase